MFGVLPSFKPCWWHEIFLTIRQRYCWPKMCSDCENFVKGCILCSIMKHKVEGKGVIGVQRTITSKKEILHVGSGHRFESG
jgi:hypothetical protein